MGTASPAGSRRRGDRRSVRRAGAAQDESGGASRGRRPDESGGGRISVTEGIMAHAMTYYAAISACSMGGIHMHPSDAVAYFYFQVSDQCCEEGGK